MGIMETERAKYAEIWTDVPEYRDWSPGMENVERFLDVLAPLRGESLIDIGCGEGGAGLEFQDHGLRVRWLDITDAALKTEVPHFKFIEAAIWSNWRPHYLKFDYAFCCDVMEHIPTEYSMLAASRVIEASKTAWFQIAFNPDAFGAKIGQPLHLTVKPFGWWLDRLQNIGTVIDARDLCGGGLFIVRSA
jgi:SAM-dependent methyltransferase